MTGKKKPKNKGNDQLIIDDQPETAVLPVIIGSNPNRKELILTANLTNKEFIWLGGVENEGIPLQPGEQTKLNTDQAIEVIGQDGDWLHVAELMREVG